MFNSARNMRNQWEYNRQSPGGFPSQVGDPDGSFITSRGTPKKHLSLPNNQF
jgi:hypothetical protein